MSNVAEGASDALDLPGDLGPLPDDPWNETGFSLPALPADSAVFDDLLSPGDAESHEAALARRDAPALAGDGDFSSPLPGGAKNSAPLPDDALGLGLDDPAAADLSAVFECEEGLASVAPPAGRNVGEDLEEPESFYSGASDVATAATATTEGTLDDRLNALPEHAAAVAASPPVDETSPAPALVAPRPVTSPGSGKHSTNTTPSKPHTPAQTRRRRSGAADAAQDDADAGAVDLLGMVFSQANLDDDDYLLRMCAATAESSKQTLRDSLKDKQREEEAAASGSGTPLTSSQKERTRSRRESAVTRRRAEVYLRQLEAIVRQVPALQRALAARLDCDEGLSGDLAQFSPDANDANSGEGSGDDSVVGVLSPGTARVSYDLGRLGLGLNDDTETLAVGEIDEER